MGNYLLLPVTRPTCWVTRLSAPSWTSYFQDPCLHRTESRLRALLTPIFLQPAIKYFRPVNPSSYLCHGHTVSFDKGAFKSCMKDTCWGCMLTALMGKFIKTQTVTTAQLFLCFNNPRSTFTPNHPLSGRLHQDWYEGLCTGAQVAPARTLSVTWHWLGDIHCQVLLLSWPQSPQL